jgi:hypothetical protein
VVSRCANPACSAHFQYLHKGQLFQFEVEAGPLVGADARGANSPSRRAEYFWLCTSCATTMTLVLEPDAGIALVPAQRSVAEGTAPCGATKPRVIVKTHGTGRAVADGPYSFGARVLAEDNLIPNRLGRYR